MQGNRTKRQIVISIVTALLIALCSYLRDNVCLPVFDSFDVISLYENVVSQRESGAISNDDSVLFINVAYDKAVADAELGSFDHGSVAITDRAKLLEFLRRAERADNYRLIFLDVHFDASVTTPYDSALFHQMLSMRDVWFSHHEGLNLPHDSLKSRALMNDYFVTMTTTNFSRYPFLQEGGESASLTIVKSLDPEHRTIKRYGPVYLYDGWRLCTNSPFLPVHGGLVLHREDGQAPDVYNLGNYFVDMPEEFVAEDLDGKLVIVGDFENDTHDTYAGPQAGSYLVFLAYKALKEGKHLVNWWMELFLFVLHALLAYGILNNMSPEGMIEGARRRFGIRKRWNAPTFLFVINLLSYSLLLSALSIALYLIFDVIRLVFVPTLILSMLTKSRAIMWLWQLIRKTISNIYGK